jgi:hypothetical protein
MFEAFPVPPYDRGRLNEYECLAPLPQHPHDRQPEDPVTVSDVGPVHASLVDGELMAKGNALKGELAAVLGHGLEQVEDQGDVGHARMIITNS